MLMKTKLIASALALGLLLGGCGTAPGNTDPDSAAGTYKDAVNIALSDEGITVDGKAISEDTAQAVYKAYDIVYYEEGHDFTYGEGEESDAHSADEAAAHTVVHITQPGTYALSGTLSQGQVAVDLGEEAEEDPNAVVTLILNDVDIACTVAPAVIFYNVYECGSADAETAAYTVDTAAAGANVIIADGTENNIEGSHVARIYKDGTQELNDEGTEVVDAKKLHKYDAAFYSKMTMNVAGEEKGDGVLNILADNEGLDSELHLTLNGGVINIESGNDGINTNEDGVSVTTVNGGEVNITVNGSTGEGDGIDSNGWLVINGGTVRASACSFSGDAGIDSDMGIYINGGTVEAGGNMLDAIAGGEQTYAVFNFAQRMTGGSEIILRNAAGEAVYTAVPANDFSILILAGDHLAPGDYTLWQGETQLAGSSGGGMGGFGGGKGGMMRPEGEMPEDMPEPQLPEGFEKPEGGFGRQDIVKNEDGTITLPDGTVVNPEDMPQRDWIGGRQDGMPQPELPDGEAPEMPTPDGFGKGGRGDFGGNRIAAETSPTFTIVEGGNMFSAVSTYEKA